MIANNIRYRRNKIMKKKLLELCLAVCMLSAFTTLLAACNIFGARYKVALPEEEGYAISVYCDYLSKGVESGFQYKFQVNQAKGYELCIPEVRVNGVLLSPNTEGYYIFTVTANTTVTITVVPDTVILSEEFKVNYVLILAKTVKSVYLDASVMDYDPISAVTYFNGEKERANAVLMILPLCPSKHRLC